ncbi:hypothetical protein [Marinobacter sp. C2H3]|uniref:hypothetical protein n=1 Tax=Marinobacter sp. C2H3 TaxID=3119003 RepID=UPI00300F12B7
MKERASIKSPISSMFFATLLCSSLVHAEVLFQESFDALPDWTSGLPENDLDGDGYPDRVQDQPRGHKIPEGWYSIRQDPTWAPSRGYSGNHENIEVLGQNADKARGGSGKSMVVWRDSTTGPDWMWNSDGIFSQYFPSGLTQVYASFWIKFDKNWTPLGKTGSTKIFRIESWDQDGGFYDAFSDGHISSAFLWNYGFTDYGARNFLSFRADPQQTNYLVVAPAPVETPRGFDGGSLSLNFTDNIRDLNGDGVLDNKVTSLLDLISGKPIGSDGGLVSHNSLWGTSWHHMEFFVKMNSQPGAMDGIAMQWMDGQLIFQNTKFPWMGSESPGGIKWNTVHFGGNSHFHAYPDSQQRQEWYAIDDITIRSDLPSNRSISAGALAPNPPSNLEIK